MGIVGISSDIAERKQAEESLRRAHDKLEGRVAERTAELENALERRDQHMSLIGEDDGRGFDVEALLATPAGESRMGMQGMQERAAPVGGVFNVESTPGTGTTIFVWIPLTVAANEGNRDE